MWETPSGVDLIEGTPPEAGLSHIEILNIKVGIADCADFQPQIAQIKNN